MGTNTTNLKFRNVGRNGFSRCRLKPALRTLQNLLFERLGRYEAASDRGQVGLGFGLGFGG